MVNVQGMLPRGNDSSGSCSFYTRSHVNPRIVIAPCARTARESPSLARGGEIYVRAIVLIMIMMHTITFVYHYCTYKICFGRATLVKIYYINKKEPTMFVDRIYKFLRIYNVGLEISKNLQRWIKAKAIIESVANTESP